MRSPPPVTLSSEERGKKPARRVDLRPSGRGGERDGGSRALPEAGLRGERELTRLGSIMGLAAWVWGKFCSIGYLYRNFRKHICLYFFLTREVLNCIILHAVEYFLH
jgi:hypothetical protein